MIPRLLPATPPGVLAALLLALPAGPLGADSPRLTGPPDPLANVPAPPLEPPSGEALGRRMRSYPEQPPIIPHSIEGYELSLRANRCLACHRRQYTEASGAPMISITHYVSREGQMLADVSPRRYFCTQCHVVQTDAPPLVENTFVDMQTLVGGGED